MIPLLLTAILWVSQATPGQVPPGVISGQLRSPDGSPAVGVRVAAAEPVSQSATYTFVSIGRTDETGRYRLEGLPPGQYSILAGVVSAPTYYPGTAIKTFANNVIVRSGSTTRGVDFVLAVPLNGMSGDAANGEVDAFGRPLIHGRFTVADGSPLPSFFGNVAVHHGAVYGVSRRPVSRDGTFILFDPTAEYLTVPAHGPSPFDNYYLQSMTFGALDLFKNPLVLSGTSREVVIALAAGSRISGVVRHENGEPANITVYLIPEAGTQDRPDLLRFGSVDSSGRFELRGIAPGQYRLSSANDLQPGRESPTIEITEDQRDVNLTLSANRSLRRVVP
jgi:hypothetical protein